MLCIMPFLAGLKIKINIIKQGDIWRRSEAILIITGCFPPGVEAKMLFNAKPEMFLWPDFLPCAVLMSGPKGVDSVVATFSPEGFADAD